MALTKPKATYAGLELAATTPITWRFTTGTRPSMATLSIHKTKWENLKGAMGQEATLQITDARGATIKIKNLTLMYEAPSSRPNVRNFVVADRRWKWAYLLISRDYNVPKKSGDRNAQINVPFAGFVTTDVYDYKIFSLKGGTDAWTSREALEDVLDQLKEEGDDFTYMIDSFPINETRSEGSEFIIQNVILRDQGDVALSRMMSYIPAATMWCDAEGNIRIINGADLDEAKAYFNNIPSATWDGERAITVERKAIRPAKVIVHYQREVECIFEYGDNYEDTSTVSNQNPARPYLENVIQTVDAQTTVTEYDPIKKSSVTKSNLPPGTWVHFGAWLNAMNDRLPPNSDPWTFDTIKMHWLHGDLDGALGAGGKDNDSEANISMRIQAIKQHFRQSFRINRRLMEATRELKNVSAMLLDPYTGARGPSRVWSQATIIPSKKGERMSMRKNSSEAAIYRNVDYFTPTQAQYSGNTIKAPHGPTAVNIIDRDLGILRIDWIISPYGAEQSFIPCLVEDESGQYRVPQRDLGQQDAKPVSAGIKVESGTNGIFLSPRLKMKILMTLIPGAPNNKRAFHKEEVTPAEINNITNSWTLGESRGPDLEVFVAPTEATARFAWKSDHTAAGAVGRLLGLYDDDSIESGIDTQEIPGFVLANQERELKPHANATAAEAYATFADSLQGRVSTILPKGRVLLSGNMSGITVTAAAAPSGKVSMMHDFPGHQKPISRLALMSEGARQVVLGIISFGGSD
tara:strand:+ start:3200 stop:5443 length:2244 start_codon:yes stop_codon:yes gene_type:complete